MAVYRYPRYDLDSSIEAARTLYEKGGGTANADAFAEYLGYKSANNGAFLSRVGSGRLFGLLEGPSSETKLSSRAMEILKPDYEYVSGRARLEAFRDVPLFGAFLQEYEGKPLPPKEGMLNVLETRFSVAKEAAPNVLTCLLNSAEQAGLFSVTGDRTKMIRPPLGGGSPPNKPPADSGAGGGGGSSSRGKLLDGVIEALPATDKWSEDLFADWLDMLVMAVRVRYQLPKPKGPTEGTRK
jgi:hypothetical protein